MLSHQVEPGRAAGHDTPIKRLPSVFDRRNRTV
jgi:hypothetical protein